MKLNMKFRKFVEPNTQVVIGNLIGDQDLPKEVVTGPSYILPQRQIYCTVSTVPQWLTFTSREASTITQLPVLFEMDCNWQRDLSGFGPTQLFKASRISNETLATILQDNLTRFASHFVSQRNVAELVATPESSGPQLSNVERNSRLLSQYVLTEVTKRLSGLGLAVNSLKIQTSLPQRLQREVEELWQLQQSERYNIMRTERNFGRAMEHSQPTVIMGQLPGELGQAHLPAALRWQVVG